MVQLSGFMPEPPCTMMVSPVTNEASGLARNTHTRPTSFSASPKRPSGIAFTFFSYISGSRSRHSSSAFVMTMGHTMFTLMLSGPHSDAATRLMPRMPSFAAA